MSEIRNMRQSALIEAKSCPECGDCMCPMHVTTHAADAPGCAYCAIERARRREVLQRLEAEHMSGDELSDPYGPEELESIRHELEAGTVSGLPTMTAHRLVATIDALRTSVDMSKEMHDEMCARADRAERDVVRLARQADDQRRTVAALEAERDELREQTPIVMEHVELRTNPTVHLTCSVTVDDDGSKRLAGHFEADCLPHIAFAALADAMRAVSVPLPPWDIPLTARDVPPDVAAEWVRRYGPRFDDVAVLKGRIANGPQQPGVSETRDDWAPPPGMDG